ITSASLSTPQAASRNLASLNITATIADQKITQSNSAIYKDLNMTDLENLPKPKIMPRQVAINNNNINYYEEENNKRKDDKKNYNRYKDNEIYTNNNEKYEKIRATNTSSKPKFSSYITNLDKPQLWSAISTIHASSPT